jgi:BirA family transcriptional regulator, biotin operon repressor / biotin---[acetyl-CoA-carboxylase] ligase
VPDSPLAGAVVPRLRGRLGRDYRFLARSPSTQRALPEDAPEGAVAVADEQTEGRGRLGRTWLAPAGTSVLCSVVLRPQVPSERLPELSIVAGRACAEAIRAATGLDSAVKLPNDVLVGERKVAGILAEASEGRVVLGIGVNVHQREDELPADTDPPATSLDLEADGEVDRRELLVALLEHLERYYDDWVASAQGELAGDE